MEQRPPHDTIIVLYLSRNSPSFVEPEVSLLSSQESITESHPDPYESNSHPQTLFLDDNNSYDYMSATATTTKFILTHSSFIF
jgi:hypothetical protein